MQGYIKLHRQILEWEWYGNINVCRLFIHCILKANHKDNKWQGVLVKKGSFVTSYENLSIETGLSIRQVRTAIDKLKMTNEITYKSTSQYSIITINNWDKFQLNDTQNDNQMTNERQTNDKQMTTNNNDNNDNNVNNEEEIIETGKIDIYADTIIDKVFAIYKSHCGSLVPLDRFYKRNIDLKKLIGSYLEQTESDLEYFARVCEIANGIKKIGDINIDLKMILRHHDGFYNGKYTGQTESYSPYTYMRGEV